MLPTAPRRQHIRMIPLFWELTNKVIVPMGNLIARGAVGIIGVVGLPANIAQVVLKHKFPTLAGNCFPAIVVQGIHDAIIIEDLKGLAIAIHIHIVCLYEIFGLSLM
jgi:hypothetical protein